VKYHKQLGLKITNPHREWVGVGKSTLSSSKRMFKLNLVCSNDFDTYLVGHPSLPKLTSQLVSQFLHAGSELEILLPL
jgi:hypothetical protein